MTGLEQAKIQQVPLKVYRAENRLTVAAPMAGMEPEDIVVDITEDGRLLLDGQVRGMLKEGKEVLLDEWSVGAYYRDYTLPEPVDGSEAVATYGNGVLVVTFPTASRLTPARLTLSSSGTLSARGVSDNTAHQFS
ncbi:MAG TPA: Hsp20/alpha crystallin family protein [Ktedonobacteraceae bacterium]|jgi:HSP20 family protein